MHCWTPTSDLYVGSEEGHLLLINGETWKVTVIQKVEKTQLGEEPLCTLFPQALPYMLGHPFLETSSLLPSGYLASPVDTLGLASVD